MGTLIVIVVGLCAAVPLVIWSLRRDAKIVAAQPVPAPFPGTSEVVAAPPAKPQDSPWPTTVRINMGAVYGGVLLANLTSGLIGALLWYLVTH